MRLLVLMLTFMLLTPLMGCKVAAYLDQYETENIAIMLKEARENRRLEEQASQERKRQAEQERFEKNVEKLQSEVEEIDKEIRSLMEKRLKIQEIIKTQSQNSPKAAAERERK